MALEDLLVSGAEIDRELLATILQPFLRIDRDTCTVRWFDEGAGLDTERRLLAYLLARKAMKALNLVNDEEARPRTIEHETGMAGGTIRPLLRKLLAARLVSQSPEKRYWVPNYALERVRQRVERRD